MKNKLLSVVISAYNEEKNITACIESVRGIASEVIVVNNSSTDRTEELAKKLGARVYTQKNDPLKIDLLKNLGFDKAQSEWIFCLDADERVTPELAQEVMHTIESNTEANAFRIPRKNVIFGKWIAHTGWYPDYQLRLFKKGKGKFYQEKVHEAIVVDGQIGVLAGPLIHENYQSVNQFLSRLIIYTDSEAQAIIKNRIKLTYLDCIKMPFDEFLRRFFTQEGYKDGLHGLVLSLLMAFYHLVIFAKVWEAEKFQESQSDMESLTKQVKQMDNEIMFWILDAKKNQTKNPLKRKILSLVQRKHAKRS